MPEHVRILLFTLGLMLGGCASYGVAVFDSHHDFHVNGVAPESFRLPWELKR